HRIQADRLLNYYRQYPDALDELARRIGYRVRPSWVWSNEEGGYPGLIIGFVNDGLAAVPGVLRISVHSEDRKVNVSGCLDAGYPLPGKVRQAKFALSKGTKWKGLRVSAEIEVKGQRHPVRWACRQKLNEDGSLTLRIAAAAAGMVEEGQCVLLDSGTTTTAIARALKDIGKLTVITNAVNIAAELSGTNIEVILTGGMLRKNSFSLVGPVAEQALRQLSADILFLGVDGFDTKAGLFTPNLLEAQVNRIMAEISRTTVAVFDSSKFGRRSLCNIMPTTDVSHVITDKNLGKRDLLAMREAGIRVTLV